MMRGGYTVSEWKEKRFKSSFPDFDVDVLDVNNDKVNGNMLLSNLRDTYLSDDE